MYNSPFPYPQVAWVHIDRQMILTIGRHVITRIPRFNIIHDSHHTWTLQIRDVQAEDKGYYMCQVNTDPMISMTGHLDVVGKYYEWSIIFKVVDEGRGKHLNINRLVWLVRLLPLPQLGQSSSILFGEMNNTNNFLNLVIVSVPPTIIDEESSPSTVSIREKHNASLICKATGVSDEFSELSSVAQFLFVKV